MTPRFSIHVPDRQCHYIKMVLGAKEVLAIVTAAICVVAFIALFANAAVIFAFAKSKQLQQPINYFAVNLAITDILIILGPLALWIVIIWHNYTLFIFKDGFLVSEEAIPHFYKFWSFIDSTLLNISVTNLAFLSLERYSAVTAPIWHRIHLTRRNMRTVCLTTWLISLAIMAPSLAFDWASLQRYFHKALPVLICCVIMMVSYILLLRQVCIKRCLDEHLSARQRRKSRREMILSLRLSLLTVAFLVCWAPGTIFAFWAAITNSQESLMPYFFVVMPTLKFLSYFHSFLNPFLYIFGRPAFATVMKGLLGCKKVHVVDSTISRSTASRRMSKFTEVGNDTRL